MFVFLPITNKCNENCVFCHQDLESEKSISQLYQEIDSAFAKFDGKINFLITGGEPSLRKEFLEILKYIRNKNANIILETNGIIFSYEDYTKKIAPLIDIALVSLHTHNAKISDELTRTKDSLQKTLNGIKNLEKYNVNLAISFVINQKNKDELYSFLQKMLSSYPKINSFMLSLVHGKKNYEKNNLSVSFEEINLELRRSIELLKKYNKKIYTIGFPFCRIKDYEDTYFLGQNNLDRKCMKTEECKICKLEKHCFGLLKEYAEKYSEKGLVAYKEENKKIKDLLGNNMLVYDFK
jgi:MoaA/NifB/PqqE/SkfB family radical SAM enzyme